MTSANEHAFAPEWWVTIIAIVSLVAAAISFVIIVMDIRRGHRQRMGIMNVVWPITALYAGPLALWMYYKVGRRSSVKYLREAQEKGESVPERPFWQSVGVGATHCGAGCTLGDIVAEWFMFFFPFFTIFGRILFANWVIDYALAYILGIIFQYYSIKPMRGLSVKEGIIAAIKADTLSLTAWQVGMYGWMAIATFVLFQAEMPKTSPVFWLMMQIAMLFGFLTAYPVNWWLIKRGIKERM